MEPLSINLRESLFSILKDLERAYLEATLTFLTVEATSTVVTDSNLDMVVVGADFRVRNLGVVAFGTVMADVSSLEPVIRVNGEALVKQRLLPQSAPVTRAALEQFTNRDVLTADVAVPGSYSRIIGGFIPVMKAVRGGTIEFGFGRQVALVTSWNALMTLYLVKNPPRSFLQRNP